MTRTGCGPTIRAGIMAVLCLLLAAPAFAQLGSLKGRVVDEKGQPVADAELIFEYSGEMTYRFTGKSNAKGEWVRAGLYSVGGRWTVSAKKGNLAGFVSNIDVPLSAVGEVGDIVVRAGGSVAAANTGASDAQRAELAKQQAALKKIFDEANAALASGSYDVALARLSEALTKVQDCAVCHLRMGDVYVKKGEFPAAEEAYRKAIAADPKSPDPYDGLAILYNSQKKFTEAAEASKKASDMRSAGGAEGSGGGGNANSHYNAGVIFWNQSKAAEAATEFEKALKLNPAMAEAHFYHGMALINLGKVPEAKKALQEYLKLAPTGPNAPIAKSVLDAM